MTVFAGIAEYERSIIVERTGREAAMRRGAEFGTRIRTTSRQMETGRDLLDKSCTVDQASEAIGMSRSSVDRLVINE